VRAGLHPRLDRGRARRARRQAGARAGTGGGDRGAGGRGLGGRPGGAPHRAGNGGRLDAGASQRGAAIRLAQPPRLRGLRRGGACLRARPRRRGGARPGAVRPPRALLDDAVFHRGIAQARAGPRLRRRARPAPAVRGTLLRDPPRLGGGHGAFRAAAQPVRAPAAASARRAPRRAHARAGRGDARRRRGDGAAPRVDRGVPASASRPARAPTRR
jgi:hypothetical protein